MAFVKAIKTVGKEFMKLNLKTFKTNFSIKPSFLNSNFKEFMNLLIISQNQFYIQTAIQMTVREIMNSKQRRPKYLF